MLYFVPRPDYVPKSYAMKYLHERLIFFQGKFKSVAFADAMILFQQRLYHLHTRVKSYEYRRSLSEIQQELAALPSRIRSIKIKDIPYHIKLKTLQFLKDIKCLGHTPTMDDY